MNWIEDTPSLVPFRGSFQNFRRSLHFYERVPPGDNLFKNPVGKHVRLAGMSVKLASNTSSLFVTPGDKEGSTCSEMKKD